MRPQGNRQPVGCPERDNQGLVPPPFLKKLSLWLATEPPWRFSFPSPRSQILLAVAIGILLLSGLPFHWPRIALPLGLFLVWTLLSLAFSPDPGRRTCRRSIKCSFS